MHIWQTCSRWSCFDQEIGLCDLQRSLPTSAVLLCFRRKRNVLGKSQMQTENLLHVLFTSSIHTLSSSGTLEYCQQIQQNPGALGSDAKVRRFSCSQQLWHQARLPPLTESHCESKGVLITHVGLGFGTSAQTTCNKLQSTGTYRNQAGGCSYHFLDLSWVDVEF